MTDIHWFSKPAGDDAGTLNPVYDVLDHPIAMGGADDIVVTGDTPEAPLIDGREVTDPRLISALSKPVELDRAEVLDRSAKLGGILRAMGVDPEQTQVRIDAEVPAAARALSTLAALRIGMVVDARSSEGAGADDVTVVRIHPIDAEAIEPGRAVVKVIRSRFEGVGITVDGQTANLDQAMRDSRVESAVVVPLDAKRTIALTDDGAVAAADGVEWLEETVLAEQ
ncbi:hypothetical protein [Brevibacterium sp. 2SA]|uniref:hypothetical protein n=1 Tax=Brevibacterium sp. 2SA TaxID=2502198 RepID=UPI0010F517C9|nr:hypothetical protein [Brevibacterium sp. 2SA]